MLKVRDFVAAIIAAGVVGIFGGWFFAPLVDGNVPKKNEKPCGVFADSWTPEALTDPSTDLEFHVSYNNLTQGRSKWRHVEDNGTVYYLLEGQTRENKLIQCAVSREFWEAAKENNSYSVPRSKCRVIAP